MSIVKADFKPAWWLPSPHLQTLWPTFFRKRPVLNLRQERLELEDGDFIDLCWSQRGQGDIVVVIHGLEGSVHSHYAGALMQTLEQTGYRPVFMHFRGCSGVPNRLHRAYHSGDTGDIAAVIAHITKTCEAPKAAIGFSLGGNALLKWLGESGENNPLLAAVAVSVPFQLADAAHRMDKGLSAIYRKYLLSHLQASYRRKFADQASPLNVDIHSLNSFWDFDDQVTAPLHGFRDVHDYYEKSSSRQYLKSIKISTRIIHAKDDPFMYPHSIPTEEELSPAVELMLARQGGHVGFVSGSFPWKAEYWYESQIVRFLGKMHQNHLSGKD